MSADSADNYTLQIMKAIVAPMITRNQRPRQIRTNLYGWNSDSSKAAFPESVFS